MKIKEIVEKILEIDERARQEPLWLQYRVYQKICMDKGKKMFIPFELFQTLPSPETIFRIRRKLNESNKTIITKYSKADEYPTSRFMP